MARNQNQLTVDEIAREVTSARRCGAPIRLLLPMADYPRGTLSSKVHAAEQETGVDLFVSFVKKDGQDYWVVQEDHKRERKQNTG